MKAIRHYWAREADDADHKEGTPVDWGPEGHVVGKHSDEDVDRERASVADEGVVRNG